MIHEADKNLKSLWRARFNSLPIESRRQLKAALWDLHRDSAIRADAQWKKHKAPMALYWRVVSVYSGHLARAIDLRRAPA